MKQDDSFYCLVSLAWFLKTDLLFYIYYAPDRCTKYKVFERVFDVIVLAQLNEKKKWKLRIKLERSGGE